MTNFDKVEEYFFNKDTCIIHRLQNYITFTFPIEKNVNLLGIQNQKNQTPKMYYYALMHALNPLTSSTDLKGI